MIETTSSSLLSMVSLNSQEHVHHYFIKLSFILYVQKMEIHVINATEYHTFLEQYVNTAAQQIILL